MTDPHRAALLAALRLTLRLGLAGVWVGGQLPLGPTVLAANHHSWWDPFVSLDLVRRERRQAMLLMDAGNLRRYRFVRRVGVIGADQPRSGLAALRTGGVLVIYPEARLLSAAAPAPLANGAAWFAQQAPAALCSAAVRVLLRGGQFAEAYVLLSDVSKDGTKEAVTARLREQLCRDLGGLDQLNAESDPRRPLPGFRCAMHGRRSWDERVDSVHARLRWRGWAE